MTVSVGLGKQLLASHGDKQEPETITQACNEIAPRCIRQRGLQQPLPDHRTTHGQSGGKTGPPDRGRGPVELLRAFKPDCLVNDLRGGARPLVGLFDFAIGERRLPLLSLQHLLTVGHGEPNALRRTRLP